MHAKLSERLAVGVIAALIVGLLAHTCIFTPTQPIAFGQRATALSAAGTQSSPVLNKRDGRTGWVLWLEPAIADSSVPSIATGSVLASPEPDTVRGRFRRAPLCPRPPPLAL